MFSFKISRNSITDNCFIIFMILTFFSFACDIPGFLRVGLWVLIVLLNYRYCRITSKMDKLVFAYCIGAFLSLSGMLFRPYPFDFFAKVFVDSYIPIIFYFIGKNTSEEIQTRFNNRCLIAFIFVYVVGLYYLVTMPSWYVSKSLEIINLNASYNEDTLKYARFGSFLDSYHVSNYGVFAICFIFGLLKTNNKRHIRFSAYICLGITIVAILLSRQRVAMFTGIIILLYYILKSLKNKSALIGLFALAILLFNFIPQLFDETTSMLVFSRFTSAESSGMVSQRTHQWIEAIEGIREPIFGNGIGSGGHIAISHGMHPSVADGSYFKIWLEGGIFSTVLFLLIIFKSFWKGWRNKDKYYVELPILGFCMCSMIGANIIDFPYVIAFMWYAIGRINRHCSPRKVVNVDNQLTLVPRKVALQR